MIPKRPASISAHTDIVLFADARGSGKPCTSDSGLTLIYSYAEYPTIFMNVNSAQKQDLTLFLRQVDVIRELGMVNKRLESVSVTLSFSAGGVRSHIKGLNMDEFRSVLAGLRQFHSPGEKVNLNHVCNILEQSGVDENTLAWVRAARQTWKRNLKSCPSHYYLEGKPVTVEESIRLYFNGVLFHSDPQIALRWDKLDDYEKNLIIYSIRAALPPLVWSLSTIDTVVDTVLNHPERQVPMFPTQGSNLGIVK